MKKLDSMAYRFLDLLGECAGIGETFTHLLGGRDVCEIVGSLFIASDHMFRSLSWCIFVHNIGVPFSKVLDLRLEQNKVRSISVLSVSVIGYNIIMF